MSLPEISRRCLSCGAAARAGSRFCQQCGKSLEADAPTPPLTKEWTPPTKEFAAFEQSVANETASPAASESETPLVSESETPVAYETPAPEIHAPEAPAPVEAGRVDEEAAVAAAAASAGDGRGRVARVREGTRARVERMRDEAIVVLEETPDDSGLRFVLVAAALFVAFLVLLFLSTTVLR